MKTPREIHSELRDAGFRVFAIKLSGSYFRNNYMLFIHPQKTKDEFREDIKFFLGHIQLFLLTEDEETVDGATDAGDYVFNQFLQHMSSLGYVEVVDVVSDVFEGCIISESSRIVHDPSHEDQKDGFGHFGWESKDEKLV